MKLIDDTGRRVNERITFRAENRTKVLRRNKIGSDIKLVFYSSSIIVKNFAYRNWCSFIVIYTTSGPKLITKNIAFYTKEN